MATLIIAGYTVPIAHDSVVFEEPIKIGSNSRSYSGVARTTVRATKIRYKCTTTWIDNALIANLRTACNLMRRVGLTGDLGGIYAIVTIGNTQNLRIRGVMKYKADLSIEEF